MICFLLGLFLTLALADPQGCSSLSPGSFSYTAGGTAHSGYVVQAGGVGSWGTVTPSGSQITIGKGPRFYLSNSCVSSFSPTVFQAFKICGGSIQFTVDVSQLGCGTNAAFYLLSMPAATAGSNGDYYCDANSVGGTACSEMDLFEANSHAIQITPHRCTSATSCDPNGCAKNTQKDVPNNSKAYGPSSAYTINSASPYTVKITFTRPSSGLSGITSVISQGNNSITMTHGSECGSGYLAGIGSALDAGMVPVWSYWTGNMAWLDSPACSSETTTTTGNYIFSNLIVGGSVITTTGPPHPPPAPSVAPGSQICGTIGCTNNVNWIEFKPPSGWSGSTTTAVVTCNGVSYTAKWDGNSKYQLGVSGSGCPNPAITLGGKPCIMSSSYAISDSTAETTFGSDQPLIIGLSVGIAVTTLVILVLIVVFFVRKQTGTYVETV